jgi:multicomponent Na+:H+ antiporter subunit E
MISVGALVILTAIWVLLWGRLSVANVLSGLLVAVALLVFVHPYRVVRPPVIRPVALVRLGLYLLHQLIVSNLLLIREVLTPSSHLSTGVVGVPLPGCSDEIVTIMTNLMALTPGTIPVEDARNPTVIYVHVLVPGDLDPVRHNLERLRDLTVAAFGRGAA